MAYSAPWRARGRGERGGGGSVASAARRTMAYSAPWRSRGRATSWSPKNSGLRRRRWAACSAGSMSKIFSTRFSGNSVSGSSEDIFISYEDVLKRRIVNSDATTYAILSPNEVAFHPDRYCDQRIVCRPVLAGLRSQHRRLVCTGRFAGYQGTT